MFPTKNGARERAKAPRFVPIQHVVTGAPQRYHILNHRIQGVLTHWFHDQGDVGRERPHHANPALCVGCRRFLTCNWKPVLGVWSAWTERKFLLSLTLEAWRTCDELQLATGKDLRGLMIVVERCGKRKNAPVQARIEEGAKLDHPLPDVVDEAEALARMWQIDRSGIVFQDEPHYIA
jgi:hypothetical protein